MSLNLGLGAGHGDQLGLAEDDLCALPGGQARRRHRYQDEGGSTGYPPAELKEILADEVIPSADLTSISATTYDTDATALNWTVRVFAICAAVAG